MPVLFFISLSEISVPKIDIFLDSYYWEFNSERFSPSGNDGRIAIQPGVGTLIFARPIKRDEGIYQCFATNKHGIAVSVKVDLRLGSECPHILL